MKNKFLTVMSAEIAFAGCQKQKKIDKWLIIFSLIAFILFSGFQCSDPEYENQLRITNATGDTIFFAEKHRSSNRSYYMLRPYENQYWGSHSSSISDIIRENYQNSDIEIEIYKLACPDCVGEEIQDSYNTYYVGPCLVSWKPPLASLPDSIHSFYNINSWVIQNGGVKNKYDIATFAITEEDLRQDEQ